MSVLSVNAKATFNELKDMLDITDGNLASHLKSLEKAGYVSVIKIFADRKPNTSYEITPSGKTAFERHLEALENILKKL